MNPAQWVLVRGTKIQMPPAHSCSAGPGLPMISEANEMEKLLHLEESFPGRLLGSAGLRKIVQQKRCSGNH
jgi:hypothetical protein